MDSDDDLEEFSSYRGVPATIILINAFDPSNHETANMAHVATCRLIRQHLRQSSTQYVGVCLYGVKDTGHSILDKRSVVEIIPLTLPTLGDYTKLQNVNMSTVNQADELILSDALWHCSKMFANFKKQLSSRTLIMLSRLDAPPVRSDQKPALKRVVDLVDSNVEIRIIRVSQIDYEIDKFYNNFLIETNKGKDIIVPKPIWDVKEIEQLMHQQSHRNLAVAQITLEIGNGLNIGVGVYSLLKSNGQSQQKTSYLDRESNAFVTKVTKTMKVDVDDNTNMDVDEELEPKQVQLLKSELLHYQEYGGERIEFTDNEMKTLKNPFGPAMLKLLGFKPASILCLEKWFLKKGYFLFPNEGIIEGSTVAFKALHKACADMGVVAICVLCTRVNARPLNVALSPCTKPLGLDVDIGFDVICIPFVENVRDIPDTEDEDTNVSKAHKNVMKDILKSIQFDYSPDMFENPKLQSQYRAIEAIALAEDDIEPFNDTTKPNSKNFQDLGEDLFQELFGSFGSTTTKRTAEKTNNETGSSNKKVKDEEIDEVSLHTRIKGGTVKNYTVTELRQILRNKNISEALTGLKKADLVDLVYKHCK